MNFLKVHSKGILTVISITGVVTTAALACRAQMAADEILRERNEVYSDTQEVEPVGVKEYVSLTWKCYIAPFVAGTLTIAAILTHQYISVKEIAVLTASVSMLIKNRDQLENAIREKYGEETLQELKKRMSLRRPEKEYVYIYAEETGKGKLLCYDGYSGRWFRSEEDEVRKNILEFSERYKDGEDLCFNDLYDMYGIEQTHFGYQYGWPDADCCGFDRSEGIPMYATRIFNNELMEDVLYIDMGYEDRPGMQPVYPIENWFEY